MDNAFMKAIIIGICAVCAIFTIILLEFPGTTTDSPARDRALPAADPDERMLAALESKQLANPVMLPGDPYLSGGRRVIDPPADHSIKTAVCGVRYLDPSRVRYEIATLHDGTEAAGRGYRITHRGYCGTCSTLRDLAAYLRHRDMTYAVRSCSIRMGRGAILSCLEKLGFSRECALTWYYNIRNTARQCLWTCLASWIRREPLNRPDGSLNACLQCDEDKSGPIFKYWAGRTRRNSGIRSEIGRRGNEIYPVAHDYY